MRSLMRQGPGPHTEYMPDPDAPQLAETLVAFANADGGTI
jgi:predicted HTH transcriptional regulator